ncbi:MAG: hypothetical protein SWY16_26715 [Cyanobacteriota bacterium]|nr:hypothetical protein [Cyanobacteriota bacterium]
MNVIDGGSPTANCAGVGAGDTGTASGGGAETAAAEVFARVSGRALPKETILILAKIYSPTLK